MTLTPEDIERQVFKDRFRGYDQEEVDRFLDRVAARIGELTKERDELSRKVRELELRTAEGAEAEQLLRRTLIAAQRTAEETVAEAQAQAEQALGDAREEAEQLLGGAREEAEQLLGDAQVRAQGLVAQAQQKARQVQVAVEELARFRSEYRERVRAVISEQLAYLEQAGDLPDPTVQLRSAAALAGEEEDRGAGGLGG